MKDYPEEITNICYDYFSNNIITLLGGIDKFMNYMELNWNNQIIKLN